MGRVLRFGHGLDTPRADIYGVLVSARQVGRAQVWITRRTCARRTLGRGGVLCPFVEAPAAPLNLNEGKSQ